MRTLQTEIFERTYKDDLKNDINGWLEDKDAFDIKSIEVKPFLSGGGVGNGMGNTNHQWLNDKYLGIITYYLPINKQE